MYRIFGEIAGQRRSVGRCPETAELGDKFVSETGMACMKPVEIMQIKSPRIIR